MAQIYGPKGFPSLNTSGRRVAPNENIQLTAGPLADPHIPKENLGY